MYTPPRPIPLSPLPALIRVMLSGDGNLLSLIPREAYRVDAGYLGYSRRSILVVNAPELVKAIMTDPSGIYPKNDLMVGALEPLVGDSLFVSSGDTWRRQRRMVEPAFTNLRVGRAFAAMTAAVDDYEHHLDEMAARGEPFSLDLAMSHLTADIITRTVFSTPLKSETARDVFDAFTFFERSVAHVELRRLIFDPPWKPVPHQESVLEACALIRRRLGELVDGHLRQDHAADTEPDIAAALIAARDGDRGFDREELIDQLGVFFLAGHETTASALTWAFFLLAQQPQILGRMRTEVAEAVGDGPLGYEETRRLALVRNIFRETMRLYPPLTFIPRVAAEPVRIGRFRLRKGAMVMIAPWMLHRHERYWRNPAAFDPDRFSPDREGEIVPGTYIPFGQGPRVCIGANFATVESALILARLWRRFDFVPLAPEKVRPVARLTTRPAEQIMVRAVRRA